MCLGTAHGYSGHTLKLDTDLAQANYNTQLIMASGSSKSSKLSFFSLSPEVRNMIYKQVLVLPEGAHSSCMSTPLNKQQIENARLSQFGR